METAREIDPKIQEFNRRVEAEWLNDETAAAWHKHHPRMSRQMRQVSLALIEAADPQPGMNVLDLASGVGDPSLEIAKRVLPGGTVTATDLNPAMLSALRAIADQKGITNVLTQVSDAQNLAFPEESFDLVTSRFGVMFFGDVPKALSEVKRVLKPGGKAAFLVWGAPIPGSYFGAAVLPYIMRLSEKPDPDGPGPMRFAEPGKLFKLLELAGLKDVSETSHNLPAPYDGTPEQFHTDLMEIAAPFRAMTQEMPEADRGAALAEVLSNLEALTRDGVIEITAPVLAVTGVKE